MGPERIKNRDRKWMHGCMIYISSCPRYRSLARTPHNLQRKYSLPAAAPQLQASVIPMRPIPAIQEDEEDKPLQTHLQSSSSSSSTVRSSSRKLWKGLQQVLMTQLLQVLLWCRHSSCMISDLFLGRLISASNHLKTQQRKCHVQDRPNSPHCNPSYDKACLCCNVLARIRQKWPYNIRTVCVDAAFSCFGICSKVPCFTKSDLTLLQLIKAGKEGVFYQARMSRGTCKGHSMFTCKISKEGRYRRGLCSSYWCWVLLLLKCFLKNKNHWLIWA